MARKKSKKVPIRYDRFMNTLKEKGTSIRKLGKERAIDRDEKTIRRYHAAGEMPPDLLDRIARFIDVEPTFLAGEYDNYYEKVKDSLGNPEDLRQLLSDSRRYPYSIKIRKEIDYHEYIRQTLTTQNISEKQFMQLSADNRVLFQLQLAKAIDSVIEEFFSIDANGRQFDSERRNVEVLLNFSKDWYADPSNPEEVHVSLRSFLKDNKSPNASLI